VAAGESSCAEIVGGETFCWGPNESGQLGIGSFETHVAVPTRMAGGRALRSVKLAGSRGCGLDPDGRAYCWGVDPPGVEPGALVPCSSYPPSGCAPAPAPVVGGLRFAAISTGAAHNCALTGDGEAYCWGSNGEGSFGNGTDANSRTPVRAAGELRLKAVGVGVLFTCGLDAAGKAYCWGNNNYGQLGTSVGPEQRDSRCDYGPCSLQPLPVAGGHRFLSIALGGDHACAISTRQTLYCWGSNSALQLASERAGRDRCGYYDHMPCSRRPAPVLRHLRFVAVSAGEKDTCAISAAGNLFCWGGAMPRTGNFPAVDGLPRRIQPAEASGQSSEIVPGR
jgi:alpha-tubulin suppressor-like RCC1 family protein